VTREPVNDHKIGHAPARAVILFGNCGRRHRLVPAEGTAQCACPTGGRFSESFA
jgi:hypothetical protein